MEQLLRKIEDVLYFYEIRTRNKTNDFPQLQIEIMEEVKDYFLNN